MFPSPLAAVVVLGAAIPAGALPDEIPLPLVVSCGDSRGAPVAGAGEHQLPDLPFRTEGTHGHVGGTARRLDLPAGCAVGGNSAWPLAWREGLEKYLVRLPRGTYRVELQFLETEAACEGYRVFDVHFEDHQVVEEVDIAREAGLLGWLRIAALVEVTDGWLDLRFVPRDPARPVRVSQIRVSSAAEPAVVVPRQFAARGGLGEIQLNWDFPPGAGRCEVQRAESAAGPFLAITPRPLRVGRFRDVSVVPGKEYFYRVQAQGLSGALGGGPTRSAVARPVASAGLPIFDLRIDPVELRKLEAPSEVPVQVPGEVHWQDRVSHVLVASSPQTDGRPTRKQSYLLLPRLELNRSIRRRRSIQLSAEAADPTLLRQRVGSELCASLGLAAPTADPVALLLNGVYQGVYHDLEPVDRRFRTRTRLDRVGLLARFTRGDHLQADWAPYGEQRGEQGNLLRLTELVHELSRLGNGEIDRWFEDRFYLERWVDRLALALARGARGRDELYLEDSRNLRWERLEASEPSGSLGIVDDSLEPPTFGAAEAQALLSARPPAAPGKTDLPSLLETRFFASPGREQRLLDRLNELLSGPLAPEKVDQLVDRAFERIRVAALEDPERFPSSDGGAAFLAGPARIKAAHRARIAVWRELLAGRGTRGGGATSFSGAALAPAEGEPWLELRNVGSAARDPRGLFLTTELHPQALRFEIPATGPIPPGERLRWTRQAGARHFPALDPAGGLLGLWSDPGGGAPPRLEDLLVLGRQTRGFLYGRDDGKGWTFRPDHGDTTAPGEIVPPSYQYRQGVTPEKNGDLRIWIKIGVNEARGERRPEKVALRYREEGAAGDSSVDLVWDEKLFQHAIKLAASPERKRTSYYFVATAQSGLERAYPLPAPLVTFSLPVLPAVKLNEVLPRPGRGAQGPGEFIEVYNAAEVPVDLEGCFLTDSKRNTTRWRIPAGNIVPPKGFAVFLADGGNFGNHTSFRLSNSGELLALYGRMEEGNLPLDTIAFRGLRTGESWGASPDGSKSFRAWKDPTPGKRNIPRIPESYLKQRAGGAGDPPGGAVPPPEPGAEGRPTEPDPGVLPSPLPGEDDEDMEDEDEPEE